MAHEFDVIETFFKPLSSVASVDEIGIGDDGAVLSCLAGNQLVVVTDTLVEGVHFPVKTSAYNIAWKALAVNLSDLAAMGATPAFYSLALSLPPEKNNQAWLELFAGGLKQLASLYNIPLVGGDTTRSDRLTITITAQGWVETGNAILRKGAQPDDLIYVSGVLGEGGLGLKAVQQHWDEASYASAIQKLNQPSPQVTLGYYLKGLATSAIDVSDGLLADLKHILSSSQVSAWVDVDLIPVSDSMRTYLQQSNDWSLPLIAGDDYELCFTVHPDNQASVQDLAKTLGVSLTKIGQIVAGEGDVQLKNAPENQAHLQSLGFEHF
ncbi:MAG: thiamine-phosphate kinase [Hydrogenovibrio crunogenus]|uniref:Thiamine-monophosphate kinase n=1 Tax=Hydrogenovibrio crunogenus (strain DSM 25203 / XCL-2) TaxID=317025 RepID=Q31FT3_HYDCU|nr:thiamine-phosphate kinase [Hydrogenovibrio crunogenus]